MQLREANRLAAVGGVRSTDTRMSSRALWNTCPWFELSNGTRDGFVYYNDFIGTYAQATNVAAGLGLKEHGLVAFTGNDAGNTIAQSVSLPTGTTTLLLTGDNLSTTIAGLGGGTAGQVVFESGKKLWFEARVKFSTITDDRGGFFLGFGEEGLCVTIGLIGATDALTDKDLVGFHRDAADGDALDLKYNTSGGGGITTHLADAVTIAADTYINLGMYFNGTSLQFYADGVKVGDPIAYTATNFPDGEEMCFYLGGTNKGTTANSVTIDWVKIAQQRA